MKFLLNVRCRGVDALDLAFYLVDPDLRHRGRTVTLVWGNLSLPPGLIAEFGFRLTAEASRGQSLLPGLTT
jgi:hypothetical protein